MFLEAPFIEWHYFFHITIDTTISSTPSLSLLLCLFIIFIFLVNISLIVVIDAVVDAFFLGIVIVYSWLFGIIGLQLIESLVLDIPILVKLVFALGIGLITNNLATEKGSSKKLLYKPKCNIANGYAFIGSIFITFCFGAIFQFCRIL